LYWTDFFLRNRERVLESIPGSPVTKLPPDVEALYQEARMAAAAGARTPLWFQEKYWRILQLPIGRTQRSF
jgi:hypothetical protein